MEENPLASLPYPRFLRIQPPLFFRSPPCFIFRGATINEPTTCFGKKQDSFKKNRNGTPRPAPLRSYVGCGTGFLLRAAKIAPKSVPRTMV